jgi:hypothetical protein
MIEEDKVEENDTNNTEAKFDFEEKNPNDYKNFNIIEKIMINNSSTNNNSWLNQMGSIPIVPSSNKTTKEFLTEVFYIQSQNTMPQQGIQSFLNLLNQSIPNINLPKSDYDTLKVMNNYKNDQTHFLEFQVCVCNGIVFEGEYAKLSNCPKCNGDRFMCNICHRKSQSIKKCNHTKTVPYKTVYYRSIIMVLLKLMEYPSFLEAIKFKHIGNHDSYLHDILYGKVAKSAMMEMDINFNKKCSSKDVINMPFLLGLNYDGTQLRKYRVSSFWPLLFSIINLPPTLRKQFDVGLFQIGLFQSKTGTPVEDFFLRNCLCEELNYLSKGFLINLNDTSYFIQVRKIYIKIYVIMTNLTYLY